MATYRCYIVETHDAASYLHSDALRAAAAVRGVYWSTAKNAFAIQVRYSCLPLRSLKASDEAVTRPEFVVGR